MRGHFRRHLAACGRLVRLVRFRRRQFTCDRDPHGVVSVPFDARLQVSDGQLGHCRSLYGLLPLPHRRNGRQHDRRLLQLRHRLAKR